MNGDIELVGCWRDGDHPGGFLDGKCDFGEGSIVRECRGIERERPSRGLGGTQEVLLLLRVVDGKEKVVTKRG